MNYKYNDTFILLLSLPLTILIILTSYVGIFTPHFYSKETLNWQIQSRGQDIVDLVLIVPALLITSVLSFRKSRIATLLWGGIGLYLNYTFIIYCFDIHFNKLFLLYCFELGLSFYSFMYFLFSQNKNEPLIQLEKTSVIFTTAIYFFAISAIFYFLWLSEIIPPIFTNSVPESLNEVGLLTNPVHVIDLSVLLPGIFFAGIILLKRKTLGFILAPVILTFFVLMDITIGFLFIIMKDETLQNHFSLIVIMNLLAMFSLIILVWYLKSLKFKSVNN